MAHSEIAGLSAQTFIALGELDIKRKVVCIWL